MTKMSDSDSQLLFFKGDKPAPFQFMFFNFAPQGSWIDTCLFGRFRYITFVARQCFYKIIVQLVYKHEPLFVQNINICVVHLINTLTEGFITRIHTGQKFCINYLF